MVEHTSTSQRFPRQARLTRARDFEQVLRKPDFRLSAGPLRLNVVFNRMHTARLGLIVGRKSVSRATARNRIKRVIRDRFRRVRSELASVDVVVRVVAPVTRTDLHRHLDHLLTELMQKTNPKTS
jgi:ribonuclease P protein component